VNDKEVTSWEPTPEQTEAYRVQEVQHAIANIEMGLRSTKAFSTTQDLLHSRATAHAAMQVVLRDRPNRFKRDPRRFGSPPRERRTST
jgi:hypothetical protein